MNTHDTIHASWSQLRNSIDTTYKTADGEEVYALRDYARDISWSDALKGLLETEIANERRHRRNRPSPKGFSACDASMLLLCQNIADGADLTSMPSGLEFLTIRKTCAEARLIGWLIRQNVSEEWKKQVRLLDYAKLMD